MHLSSDQHKYRAFISYSSKDSSSAQWWHNKLENYPIPPEFQSARLADGHLAGAHLRPIFRDRAELSGSPKLAPAIQAALKESTYLIVLCSPNSATSEWVEKEIQQFKQIHSANRILAVILSGEPNATSDPKLANSLECFPPSLRHPREPLAADTRRQGDGKSRALLKIISGMTGIEFDKLYQRHEKAQRQKRLLLASLATLIILALTGLTIYAKSKQLSAEIAERAARQSERSERYQRQRTEVARAAADQVINTIVFDLREELTDKDLTPVLEKVLRTAREYWQTFPPKETLSDERNNARVATLSESIVAYRKQAKFPEALRLGNQAIQISDQFVRDNPFSPFAHRTRLNAYLEHGVTHLESGDPKTAAEILTDAHTTAHTLHNIDPSPINTWHLACIEQYLAKAHFALAEYEKSLTLSHSALKHANTVYQHEASDQNARLLVSIQENLGKTHLKLHNYPKALKSFQDAEPIIKNLQSKNPNTKNNRNLGVIHQNLGITLLNLGDEDTGLDHLNKLLNINQKIYNKNPSAQNTLNLAISHEILTRTYADLAKTEPSLKHAHQNLELSSDLHEKLHNNQSLNRLIAAHKLIAIIEPIQKLSIRHRTTATNLIKSLPQTPTNLKRLVDANDDLAQTHINSQQLKRAITHLEDSLTYLKILHTQSPNQDTAFDLAVGHQNLANTLLNQQTPISAQKALNNLIAAKNLLKNTKTPDPETQKLLQEIQTQINSPTFLQ